MTKRITTVALLSFSLAVPASAGAAEEPSQANFKNAAKYCKALRAASGDANFKAEAAADQAAFRAKYGTGNGKNAHGKCVSQKAKENKAEADKQEKQDVNSAKECRTEQKQNPDEFKAAHGGKTFTEFYGTNENGKNAFGKCVSSKSKAANQDGQTTQS